MFNNSQRKKFVHIYKKIIRSGGVLIFKRVEILVQLTVYNFSKPFQTGRIVQHLFLY